MRQDQDALLEKLFREHFTELEAYAYALLKDRDQAQVAVQDAFHTACEKIDALMHSSNQIGWMKSTVKNVARNMIRRKNRELQLVIPLAELQTEPHVEDLSKEELELRDQCSSLLTQEEFQLVMSVVVDGVPYVEKAKELNITMWACYKRVNRALEKLKRGLEHEK